MVTLIFWAALLLLVFPYVLYPVLLRMAPRRERAIDPKWEPELTIVIAAYNEEKEIARKLDNTLALDYPASKRHIIVSSDCSADRTDDIVRGYTDRGVQLIRLPQRGGKTAAQNAALEAATGEAVVFTDCGTHLEPAALRALIGPLSDPDTACSGGYLEFADADNPELAGRKRRMTDFDQQLKEHESEIDSVVGVNGALYAWRRDVASALPPHLTSDLMVPLATIAAGKRVAFASSARGTEAIAPSESREFARKIRTARAGITVARHYARLFFDFARPWVTLALWGHKGLRWLGLPLLVLILAASALRSDTSGFFQFVYTLQMFFYLVAVLGWVGVFRGPLRLPYYFVFLNLAACVALVQSLLRPPSEVWETGTQ